MAGKGARLFRGWHAEQLAPPFAQKCSGLITVSATPTSAWGRGRYAIEAIGVGPRSTSSGTNLPGHLLTNVNYSMRISRVDVSLGIYNLFNQRHYSATSLEIQDDAPAAGRAHLPREAHRVLSHAHLPARSCGEATVVAGLLLRRGLRRTAQSLWQSRT